MASGQPSTDSVVARLTPRGARDFGCPAKGCSGRCPLPLDRAAAPIIPDRTSAKQ